MSVSKEDLLKLKERFDKHSGRATTTITTVKKQNKPKKTNKK